MGDAEVQYMQDLCWVDTLGRRKIDLLAEMER